MVLKFYIPTGGGAGVSTRGWMSQTLLAVVGEPQVAA